LIPMYTFFILNYRRLIALFIKNRYSGDELVEMQEFLRRSQVSVQNYLRGTLLLTAICAIISLLILLSFGVRYAFFFGVFIAVLNLVPYIGNLIAFIVVLLFVWITKESALTTLFVGLSLYISNAVQENLLRPKIIGDKMEINAMMIFTGVIVGGIIWGFSGMVLFIPILGIIQAFITSHKAWKVYGIFFTRTNIELVY